MKLWCCAKNQYKQVKYHSSNKLLLNILLLINWFSWFLLIQVFFTMYKHLTSPWRVAAGGSPALPWKLMRLHHEGRIALCHFPALIPHIWSSQNSLRFPSIAALVRCLETHAIPSKEKELRSLLLYQVWPLQPRKPTATLFAKPHCK